jgi:tetratricopeptide (TPR) repeat protein
MTRRRTKAPASFFDRFRGEVARYAEGVHLLGGPARQADLAAARGELGAPPEYVSFLESWNGAELFHESTLLAGVGEHAVGGGLGQLGREEEADEAAWPTGALEFARGPSGARFAFDREGRVWSWDADEEEVLLEAARFEPWLDGVMAREGLVMDRDGEYREEAFDEDDFTPAIEVQREERTLEIEPASVGAAFRLALAERRAGRPAKALAALEKLAAAELPIPMAVRIELARSAAERGQAKRALEVAREIAAAARPPAPRAGMLVAEAARWAELGKDADLQAELGARARALAPDVLSYLREGGAYELEAGRPERARELLETARALAPRDLSVLELIRRIPSR